jgi:hypothetical protein
MEKIKSQSSQSNKRQPGKKVSDVGRVQRNSLRHRMSLAKSIGKLRKGEQETPIVAIQQVHLLRKQKTFLTKQAFVFEKKAETVREQAKALEVKIKFQRELAMDLVKGLEEEEEEGEEDIRVEHRSKPDKTIEQKTKKFFRLDY